MELLGPRLREIRKASKKTQEEICAASGLTQAMISQFENGKGDPALSTVRKLARAYGVTVAMLFSDEPPPPPPPQPPPRLRDPTPAEVAMFVLGNFKISTSQREVIQAILEHPELADSLRKHLPKKGVGHA